MTALCASILALVLGPVLLATGRGGRRFAATLDAFVVIVVVGVVLLHYVPHALLEAGPLVLLGMLLGLSVPYWAERASHAHGAWVRPLAFSAFTLHAALDGAALGGAAVHAGQEAFVLALIVHRVAEGLAIHHLTRNASRRAAWLALGGVVLATLIGYAFGEHVASMGETRAFLFIQTLTSGALLHVVLHGHAAVGRSPAFEALGTLLGLVVIAGLTLLDPELVESARELSMGTTVLALALHLAPALLVATALAIALDYAFGARGGALAGLVRPPRAHGEYAGTRVALLGELAHPALLVVSFALLGPVFALLRWLSGLVSALVLPAHRVEPGEPEPRSLARSAGRALEASVSFLVLGVLCAAWLEPVLAPGMFADVPWPLALVCAALLGLPLRASALGVTPLLVVLAHKGLDPGALLAFALTSSMAPIVGRGRPPLAELARAAALAIVFGALAHYGLPGFAVLDLHAHAAAAPDVAELVCLALCVLALLGLLIARGPREVFGPAWPLVRPEDGHAHPAHDHIVSPVETISC